MKHRHFVGDEDFEGNRFPVYAASQVRVGGFKPEEVFIFALTTTVFDVTGISVEVGAMLGIILAWQYRKHTNALAPGMLHYVLSTSLPKWAAKPGIGFLFSGLSRMISATWTKVGSIPPHNTVKYYEP